MKKIIRTKYGKIWKRSRIFTDFDGLIFRITNVQDCNPVPLKSVFFNSGGTMFCCADSKGKLLLFDIEENYHSQVENVLVSSPIISFSPTRKYEFLSNVEKNVITRSDLSLSTVKEKLGSFKHEHNNAFVNFCYNSDGRIALSCSAEKIVIWNIETSLKIKVIHSSSWLIQDCKFSPLGNFLVALLPHELHLWSCKEPPTSYQKVNTINIPTSLRGEIGSLSNFSISSNEKYLLCAGKFPYLLLWELDDKNISNLRIIKLSGREMNRGVKKTKIFQNEELVFLLTNSGTFVLLELCSLRILHRLSDIHSFVDFDITKDSRFMVCASDNGAVYLYNLEVMQNHFKKLNSIMDQAEYYNVADMNKMGILHQDAFETPDLRYLYTKNKVMTNEDILDEEYIQSGINYQVNSMEISKLKRMLKISSNYPNEYRKMIWKVLNSLPVNKDYISDLLMPHRTNLNESQKSLVVSLRKYFNKYKTIFNFEVLLKYDKISLLRMKKVIEVLGKVYPSFIDSKFIPEIIFPFVKFFQSDLVSVSEIVLTFIFNWAKFWFSDYPRPPSRVLETVKNMLFIEDKPLLNHLLVNGISPKVFCWKFIRSLYSDILKPMDWLIAFDHIFSSKLYFYYFFNIAILKYFRKGIMKLNGRKKIEKFFQTQICPERINVRKIILLVHKLQSKIERFDNKDYDFKISKLKYSFFEKFKYGISQKKKPTHNERMSSNYGNRKNRSNLINEKYFDKSKESEVLQNYKKIIVHKVKGKGNDKKHRGQSMKFEPLKDSNLSVQDDKNALFQKEQELLAQNLHKLKNSFVDIKMKRSVMLSKSELLADEDDGVNEIEDSQYFELKEDQNSALNDKPVSINKEKDFVYHCKFDQDMLECYPYLFQ